MSSTLSDAVVIFYTVFVFNAIYIVFFKLMTRSIKTNSPDIWEKIRVDSDVGFGITVNVFKVLYTNDLMIAARHGKYQMSVLAVRIFLPLCTLTFLLLMWIVFKQQ